MGIWRHIYMESRPTAYIKDVYVETLNACADYADLKINYNCHIEYGDIRDYRLLISGKCGESEFSCDVNPMWHTGGNYGINLRSPKLWYPRNYGDANLYHVTAELCYKGEPVHKFELDTGVRSVFAYCKINYPLAYYGAYFGIRADAFSYEIMCQGKEKLQYYIDDYNRRSATLSKKEQDTMKDMKIVQEMYARGFEFEPLDIYKAQATKFLIVNGKLMPPLSSIDGMGEKAAEAVAEASKDGTYLSLDDFRQRTKASKTVIDTMVDLGILADLPASNQLSLFDF